MQTTFIVYLCVSLMALFLEVNVLPCHISLCIFSESFLYLLNPPGECNMHRGRMQSSVWPIVILFNQHNKRSNASLQHLPKKVSKHLSTQQTFSKKKRMSMAGVPKQASAGPWRGAAELLTHMCTCVPVYLIGLIVLCNITSTPAREYTKKHSHCLGERGKAQRITTPSLLRALSQQVSWFQFTQNNKDLRKIFKCRGRN